MSIKQLSVFFPLYNEEENTRPTVEKAIVVLKQLPLENFEIILINDGSKDKTADVIEKLSEEYPFIRPITHSPNRGYGGALKSGFYNAQYPWIVFTDADGQFNFSEISQFIEKQNETGADLVIGYYKKRNVGLLTRMTTKVFWEPFVILLFGLHVKDIDCAFKLISKKVIDTIPKLESERGAFISSELLINAKRMGFKITEVGVTHYSRVAGKGTGRDIKVIVKSYTDLLKLWWKLHFSPQKSYLIK